jgi:hypothetical protein
VAGETVALRLPWSAFRTSPMPAAGGRRPSAALPTAGFADLMLTAMGVRSATDWSVVAAMIARRSGIRSSVLDALFG